MFMCCRMDPLDWIETYYLTKAHSGKKLLDAYLHVIPHMMLRTLPRDAYQRCSGRVFISMRCARDCSCSMCLIEYHVHSARPSCTPCHTPSAPQILAG